MSVIRPRPTAASHQCTRRPARGKGIDAYPARVRSTHRPAQAPGVRRNLAHGLEAVDSDANGSPATPRGDTRTSRQPVADGWANAAMGRPHTPGRGVARGGGRCSPRETTSRGTDPGLDTAVVPEILPKRPGVAARAEAQGAAACSGPRRTSRAGRARRPSSERPPTPRPLRSHRASSDGSRSSRSPLTPAVSGRPRQRGPPRDGGAVTSDPRGGRAHGGGRAGGFTRDDGSDWDPAA